MKAKARKLAARIVVPAHDDARTRARSLAFLPVAAAAIAGMIALAHSAPGRGDAPAAAEHAINEGAAPIFVKKIPSGYRDWKLISVAHEAGELDDLRAILGNDKAIKAYRDGKLPFPEGTIIARIAWGYEPSTENNEIFKKFGGSDQSFVAGAPKNGVQFMVKDSKKYAATGGWGYAEFDDGKPADDKVLEACFPCHQAIKERDYVFTHYSP
jgi:hypothetical protein